MSKKIYLLSAVFLILGIIIGRLLPEKKIELKSMPASDSSVHELREGGYKFINPLLECDTISETVRLNGLNTLEKAVSSYLEKEKADGNLTNAAVYYRDLNDGPWFGVNERAPFAPASLLKLPVMMAYFKKAEKDPSVLTKKIVYQAKDQLLGQDIVPTKTIQKGQSYTIEELIVRMMEYSDNAALTVLEDNIDPMLIDKVTLDLGVETATVATPDDFMSVRGYSSLFRILYNASYIEKDLSEKALEIMSKSEFNDGLVAGVPKGIIISHKFGERERSDGSEELHDCGIVYHPSNPYLICVMTKGDRLEDLKKVISDVSRMVYEVINSRTTSK